MSVHGIPVDTEITKMVRDHIKRMEGKRRTMIVDDNFVLKHYFKVHCSGDRTLIVDSLDDFKNIPIVAEEVYEFTKMINILPNLKEEAKNECH